MKFRKYTKEQFIDAVLTSNSIREVLTKLNVAPHGGNYAVAKKYIKELALNISHMNPRKTGVLSGYKRPISDYLENKFSIHSHRLKLRLLREGLMSAICAMCGLSQWLDGPIPLELDHIDGNNKNNNLNNLRLLCPNCHAKTPTYRGRNIK